MRHQKAGSRLGRTSSHKEAMLRNLVTSLFKHERIKTTDAKAREMRGWVDHIITLAKKGDLHSRRQVLSILREKEVVKQLFEEAKDRFTERNSGYTRIVKIERRSGDSAPISLVELIGGEEKKKKSKTKKKKTPVQKKMVQEENSLASGKSDVTVEQNASGNNENGRIIETPITNKGEEKKDAQAPEGF